MTNQENGSSEDGARFARKTFKRRFLSCAEIVFCMTWHKPPGSGIYSGTWSINIRLEKRGVMSNCGRLLSLTKFWKEEASLAWKPSEKKTMTQEELLEAARRHLAEFKAWREENDKHRQDDSSFPYYEEGYEDALSDAIYFLEHGEWEYPLAPINKKKQ